jgi:hypothetical protein
VARDLVDVIGSNGVRTASLGTVQTHAKATREPVQTQVCVAASSDAANQIDPYHVRPDRV